MTSYNFKCPVCNNAYSKVNAFRISEFENFAYYGIVPLEVNENGVFSLEESKILPVIVMICKHCGHLALFHAKIFEEALEAGK